MQLQVAFTQIRKLGDRISEIENTSGSGAFVIGGGSGSSTPTYSYATTNSNNSLGGSSVNMMMGLAGDLGPSMLQKSRSNSYVNGGGADASQSGYVLQQQQSSQQLQAQQQSRQSTQGQGLTQSVQHQLLQSIPASKRMLSGGSSSGGLLSNSTGSFDAGKEGSSSGSSSPVLILEPQRMPQLPLPPPGYHFLDPSLIPVNTTASADDEVVEGLLALLLPSELQLAYRQALVAFLSKHVRKSLSAKLFELGGSALRCALPDDPIRVSVVVCRSQEASWHSKLNERLCVGVGPSSSMHDDLSGKELMEGTMGMGMGMGLGMGMGMGMSLDMDGENDDGLTFPVGSVLIGAEQSQGYYKIQCQVASVSVDIAANIRMEVLMAAFLEEVDRLVGKQHLFKRSLVLIRAWWAYEARNYSTDNIGDALSESAISVMVCAVFNKHHSHIYFPLQALALFFSEYSMLDWGGCVLMLHGPAALINGRFESPSEGHEDLLGMEMLAKYQDAMLQDDVEVVQNDFAVATPAATAATAPPPPPLASSPVPSLTLSMFPQSQLQPPPQLPQAPPPPQPQPQPTGSAFRPVGPFERQALNIAHPFCCDINLVTDIMTPEKAVRLIEFLQESAKALGQALETFRTTGQSGLSELYRNTMHNYGDGWRPDFPPDDMRDRIWDSYRLERLVGEFGSVDSDIGNDIDRDLCAEEIMYVM